MCGKISEFLRAVRVAVGNEISSLVEAPPRRIQIMASLSAAMKARRIKSPARCGAFFIQTSTISSSKAISRTLLFLHLVAWRFSAWSASAWRGFWGRISLPT
jgi:hypothetical protein